VTPAELLAAAGPNPAGVFLSLSAGAAPAPEKSGLWVLVGPEGGFSPGEEAAFLAAGLRPWRLGPLTLRTETAALAALALYCLPEETITIDNSAVEDVE
jgi:16S rRNA U1498 N3-methylase RsmE